MWKFFPLLLSVLWAASAHAQAPFTPRACDVTTIAAGPTAVKPLSTTSATGGVVNGGYITNPLSDADQGVTAEPLYINPTTTATTTGNGTNLSLAPGQSFYFPSDSNLSTLSAMAATAGHKFTCVRY